MTDQGILKVVCSELFRRGSKSYLWIFSPTHTKGAKLALQWQHGFLSCSVILLRNEIESQIRQVDREIQQCHDEFGPGMDSMSYGEHSMVFFNVIMFVYLRIPP